MPRSSAENLRRSDLAVLLEEQVRLLLLALVLLLDLLQLGVHLLPQVDALLLQQLRLRERPVDRLDRYNNTCSDVSQSPRTTSLMSLFMFYSA